MIVKQSEMELESAVASPAEDAKPNGIAIEIESDPKLGYASIQNSVPVIRSLRLTDHDDDALEGLEVLIIRRMVVVFLAGAGQQGHAANAQLAQFAAAVLTMADDVHHAPHLECRHGS